MNKEQLRMQMLAGIITEGQYKSLNEELNRSEDFSDLVYKDMWNDLLAWAKSNRTSSRKNAKYPSESKQEAYLLSIAPKYRVDVNILKKTLKQYDDLHNRTYGMIPGGLTWQEWVDAKIIDAIKKMIK
jgi:hypothetical protein